METIDDDIKKLVHFMVPFLGPGGGRGGGGGVLFCLHYESQKREEEKSKESDWKTHGAWPFWDTGAVLKVG